MTCKRGHINPARYKSGACMQCQKDRANADYRLNRPEKIRKIVKYQQNNPDSRRDQQRATKFGVTVGTIRAIVAKADGKCEACFRPLTPAQMCMDHDHESGQIRGVLCRFCNALEGMINKQKDRVDLVKAYVERHLNREIERLGKFGS